ncbi:hypothetical protein QBC47DRAFT_424864 [Echria macrotheca]|uniref:Zn(2)-C6 fungal-type domain-containing protein n=1 Tax=Echria macrotheca TaxID=438768 RepID=A0AAJ0F6W5_9PEZI|nr:hypothetical protein QBC47DRAFT_424864 [Echria macrotheca]
MAAPREGEAKLSVQGKAKVREVRRQGACLRCRMLKIQCSNNNPCQPCLQSALRGSERKVLSFCYCVRTRFADVNIFESAQTQAAAKNMQIEHLMSQMGVLLARIATPANFITSDPVVFTDKITAWLSDPNFNLPDGSIVGICCSSLLSLQFRDDSLEDDGLATEFRRFMLASSLAHSGWKAKRGGLRRSDVSVVGHVAGYRLIKRLDRILTPQFLAKCDQQSCQVLFLLVLGTVLGMSYASSFPEAPSTSPELLGSEFRRNPTLWLAMKEHLCQMLAHHLIFLGSILGIKLETGLEQNIIDTATQRWKKIEPYVWADTQFTPLKLPYIGPMRPNFGLKNEFGVAPSPSLDRSYSEEPPPFPPSTQRMIPIAFPEMSHFQPSTTDDWSQNPQSYLDMTDEPESYYTASQAESSAAEPENMARSQTEPLTKAAVYSFPETGRQRSRTMWLVRPIDAGPEHGQVNVHARLRGPAQGRDFQLFV